MVFHIFVYSLNLLFTQKTPFYHYSWFSSRGPIVIPSGHQTPTSTPILITSRFTNLRAVNFTAMGGHFSNQGHPALQSARHHWTRDRMGSPLRLWLSTFSMSRLFNYRSFKCFVTWSTSFTGPWRRISVCGYCERGGLTWTNAQHCGRARCYLCSSTE